MPGFRDINQLRNAGDYAATYLWDIRFPDPYPKGAPYPFNDWFPAKNVDEPVFSMYSKEIEYYLSRYTIPQGINRVTMSMSFYDNDRCILENWLRGWFNLIFNDHYEVTPLEDCIKVVEVHRLNRRRETVQTTRYWVYPENNLRVFHNSENSIRLLEFSLNVVGSRMTNVTEE